MGNTLDVIKLVQEAENILVSHDTEIQAKEYASQNLSTSQI